jgi:hypothetical protein
MPRGGAAAQLDEESRNCLGAAVLGISPRSVRWLGFGWRLR